MSTNEARNLDLDFVGDGGSVSETFTWSNPGEGDMLAEYSMDITTGEGEVEVVVLDAEGAEVAAFGLVAGEGDDSLDGATDPGVGGDWTVTVTIVDFAGDGSLNLDGGSLDDI